ncbi:MFS transporter [Betaproteobacteria bacterium GR16-43]|nr:MFS transporter [Betaproteobacteria bacterium GR16-43]
MSAASPVASLRQDATVISLVGYVHGTSHFFHFMFPALFPWLMADFGLNFTQVGLTMTVFFVVSGIGQALSGFVVDRIGALRVLYGGTGLLALSGLALAAAQNFPMLLFAAFLAGLGNCVFHPVDFTLLNRRVSHPRLGHAFSVHGLTGNLGWAVAPVMLTTIATAWHWRVAGVAAAIVGLVALLVAFANRETLGDAHAPTEADGKPKGGTFDFLRTPTVWLCFTFFLIVTLAFGALQNYSTPIFREVYGVSIPLAASALTAYLLASAAGTATGGFFAAQGEGQDRRVAIALAIAAVAAAVLASAVLSAFFLPVLMAIMGFCVGFSGPSRDILVRRAATSTFGQRAFGRVYGFTYSGLDVGFAIAPLVFGPMMDGGQYTHVLWGAAALQLLAITTALTVGSRARVKAAPN